MFPLFPGSKIPYKDWHWLEQNSTNVMELEYWAKWLPESNWAVKCGPDSLGAVLDFDVKNGKHGLDEYQRCVQEYGPEWCDTVRVRTWSGGLQTYHIWQDGIVKDNTGKVAPDVDCQGMGTYVVSPGSVVNGKRYEFDQGSDGEKDLSPFPQWAWERLHDDRNEPRRAKANGSGKFHQGDRTRALVSFAGRLFNVRIDFPDFLECLQVWNQRHCDPPLSTSEVARQAECYHRFRAPVEAEGEVVKRKFSQIERRQIQWLWKPYMAAGMITLLSGDPGIGKSFVALDRAAEVTRNGGFVLYLSIENPPEEVLAPRFEALRGNPEMIELIEGVEYGGEGDKQVRGITLRDLKILEKEIKLHENVQLIVVDPVQSYLGEKVDAHRSNETRPVLDGLTALCRRYGVAPLILRHCSKASTGKVLYRGLGSIDFTAAARSELIVGEQNGRMAMAHLKTNLSKRGPTLGYEIVESDGVMLYETGLFRWTGECDLKPEDLVDEEAIDEEQKSALDEAEAFLKDLLASGPLDNKQVVSIGKDAGIADRTLKRAKARLKIRAVRSRTGWDWVL